MRGFILIPVTAAALSLAGAAASAVPTHGLAVGAPPTAVTLVGGWWEQENHSDAPDRYWQMNRTERKRYDAAETRIQKRHNHHVAQYNQRDARDVATEHRLLHYETHG